MLKKLNELMLGAAMLAPLIDDRPTLMPGEKTRVAKYRGATLRQTDWQKRKTRRKMAKRSRQINRA